MTESIAKKIGFGLLVLGLLAGAAGTASAQAVPAKGADESWADYNRRTAHQGKTGNTVTANQRQAGGIGDNMFVQQAANTFNQNVDRTVNTLKTGAQGATVATINTISTAGNAEVLGFSLTGHAGDRVNAALIKAGGDNAAQYVASAQGISQENLGKVSAADTWFGSRDALTYKLDDGTTVNMDANLNSTEGMMEGCMPIPVKLDQMKNCIFCPLFLILYNTAEAMATASFDVLAGGFKVLLLIGFGLYIAYMTLRQVSAFTKQDAPKYITEALTMAFKVFLAWLLLTNGAELYRLGLEPLLSAGIEFGQSFLTHQNTGGTNVDIASCAATGGTVSGTTTYFYSHGLYEKIDCYLRKVTQEIAVSQSIGSSLMCVARHKASGVIMWDLTMMFTGLIMWLFAWLICLAFSFYLIDSVIRLGIIGAITPFLIAAWPFKITQGYTGTGWKMFLNAFFTFVFLGLVVSVNVELSAQAATGGATVTTASDGGSEVSSSGVEAIMALINSNDIEALLEVMSIGLSGLIFMILCCVFGFKLCAEAASLAGEFSGAKSTDLGSKVGSMAAGAAKGIGVGTAKAAGKGAMIMGEATGINDAVREGVDGLHQGFNNAVKKGMGKIGLSRFSATAAGRLKNQGMAQNTGSGQQGNQDNEDQDKERLNNQGPSNQQPTPPQGGGNPPSGTPGTPEAESTGSRPVSASGTQNNNGEGSGNGESSTGGASEAAVADAEGAAPRSSNDNARNEALRETEAAKTEIAGAAVAEAEKNSHVANGGTAAQSRFDDNEDKKGKKKESGAAADMRDELDASKQTIAQLRAELDELKKKLREQGGSVSSTAGSSDMAERIKKLEEELKRRGGSI